MDEIKEMRALLDSPEFKKRFRDNLVEEARKTGTSLSYVDSEGRYVEEWPATGELYEVRHDVATDRTIRIQTLHVVESIVH